MVKKNTMRFAKPVLKRKQKEMKMSDAQVPSLSTLPEFLRPLTCDCCVKVRGELVGSLQRSVAKMTEIAANGGGHEVEAATNAEYNRYFGCAIAADTMLKEYFGFPKNEDAPVGDGIENSPGPAVEGDGLAGE